MKGKLSTTDSPRVWSSSPVRGSFFFLIQFWHRCLNDLFKGTSNINSITTKTVTKCIPRETLNVMLFHWQFFYNFL